METTLSVVPVVTGPVKVHNHVHFCAFHCTMCKRNDMQGKAQADCLKVPLPDAMQSLHMICKPHIQHSGRGGSSPLGCHS